MRILVLLWCAVLHVTYANLSVLEVRSSAKLNCSYIDLTRRALNAWAFEGITKRFKIKESASNSTGDVAKDGVNEFLFGPFAASGVTKRYHTDEIDVVINADKFPDCRTLYATVLHEMGHVLGLDHPRFRQDSVMGLWLQMKSDSDTFESIPYWAKPTHGDVRALFDEERRFYFHPGKNYYQLRALAFQSSPRTLSELQICAL